MTRIEKGELVTTPEMREAERKARHVETNRRWRERNRARGRNGDGTRRDPKMRYRGDHEAFVQDLEALLGDGWTRAEVALRMGLAVASITKRLGAKGPARLKARWARTEPKP